MDESKRLAVRFLEKEIETYKALALFLSKEDIKKHLRVTDTKALTRPAYYKERMREAKEARQRTQEITLGIARTSWASRPGVEGRLS